MSDYFSVRITTIWEGNVPVTKGYVFNNWHDALHKAEENMEGLRRCAEDPEMTHIIGYRVMIEEWLGADQYRTRLKAEYQHEDWRNNETTIEKE